MVWSMPHTHTYMWLTNEFSSQKHESVTWGQGSPGMGLVFILASCIHINHYYGSHHPKIKHNTLFYYHARSAILNKELSLQDWHIGSNFRISDLLLYLFIIFLTQSYNFVLHVMFLSRQKGRSTVHDWVNLINFSAQSVSIEEKT